MREGLMNAALVRLTTLAIQYCIRVLNFISRQDLHYKLLLSLSDYYLTSYPVDTGQLSSSEG